MKRIDTVLQILTTYSKSLSKEHLAQASCGLSALEIAQQTTLLRNNVSKDLNDLFRQRKVLKIKGRPVRFLERTAIEQLIEGRLNQSNLLFQQAADICTTAITTPTRTDPFLNLIGHDGSLSQVIQTAKAAILYPPSGLHSLLLGESGVGKSLFAEVMFEYGAKNGVFQPESPFVRFNCADYANNPQLLMAQLFGAAKGAFTGADEVKIGMIEAADGGVLFLDEIHRLPHEGQEMLFHFIDKKIFRRLGETVTERKANVTIIGATTETDNSSLLTTFLRRIPSVIWLPKLEERSAKEKLELIRLYTYQEAKKIGCPIKISHQALLQFVLYNPPGNLGQLKSDLQLSVARAYLEAKQNNQEIVLVNTQSQPSYLLQHRKNLSAHARAEAERMLPEALLITPPSTTEQHKLPINIEHDFISYYLKQLLAHDKNMDVEKVFREYTNELSKNMLIENDYSILFDETTRDISKILAELLVDEYQLNFDKKIYMALALFIRNIKENHFETEPNQRSLTASFANAQALNTAKKMATIIERRFHIYCSTQELITLASIIETLVKGNVNSPVHYMVVAHGSTTGTSIAETVNELLNTNILIGLNMPLSMTPVDAFSKIKEQIARYPANEDWILFVDMGSLAQFNQHMNPDGKQTIHIVETINLGIILESVRKSLFTDTSSGQVLGNIAKIHDDLNYKLQTHIRSALATKTKRIIYTVCSSGEGIAQLLVQILSDFLRENNLYDIEIIPLSGQQENLEYLIKSASKNKEIIAIIGSIQLANLQAPFISLDQILTKQGLLNLLDFLHIPVNRTENISTSINKATRSLTIKLCSEALEKYLAFLSADKLIPILDKTITNLETAFAQTFENSLLMKLIIHLGCMTERISFENKLLTVPENELLAFQQAHAVTMKKVENALLPITSLLQLSVCASEQYYIAQILAESGLTLDLN